MAHDELLEFDVATLADRLRTKQLSPVELTDAVYAVWQRAVDRARGWAEV